MTPAEKFVAAYNGLHLAIIEATWPNPFEQIPLIELASQYMRRAPVPEIERLSKMTLAELFAEAKTHAEAGHATESSKNDR